MEITLTPYESANTYRQMILSMNVPEKITTANEAKKWAAAELIATRSHDIERAQHCAAQLEHACVEWVIESVRLDGLAAKMNVDMNLARIIGALAGLICHQPHPEYATFLYDPAMIDPVECISKCDNLKDFAWDGMAFFYIGEEAEAPDTDEADTDAAPAIAA